MKKMLISDAYRRIVMQINKKDLEKANNMLAFVESQIEDNKKHNTISRYIVLSDKNEIALFMDI